MSRPRAALAEAQTSASGIVAGCTGHRILLALRAGPLTQEQVYARFPGCSGTLFRLENAGLITKPAPGKKGEALHITTAGRDLVAPGGPMSRKATEIVYCQL